MIGSYLIKQEEKLVKEQWLRFMLICLNIAGELDL